MLQAEAEYGFVKRLRIWVDDHSEVARALTELDLKNEYGENIVLKR